MKNFSIATGDAQEVSKEWITYLYLLKVDTDYIFDFILFYCLPF